MMMPLILGEDIARGYDEFNGMHYQRGVNKCQIILHEGPVTMTSPPAPPPLKIFQITSETPNTSAERGYKGEVYFNYDRDDL